MVKPISLRLRHTQAIDQAEATLIRAGRGEEVKRLHARKVMREARRNVEKAKEQARLKRCAALAAYAQAGRPLDSQPRILHPYPDQRFAVTQPVKPSIDWFMAWESPHLSNPINLEHIVVID
jgi:hypothetical protein